ncbi:MAG: T9SS type A sorting domain-containing protein [Candidatus Kapabacteria bacterium]|nr:T9SS type A sorting domain-containing protein [Candidatus Kapabacteria bacterium]
MKKKSFLVAAITTLLLCQFTPLWTQGEPKLLEEIWRRDDIDLTYFTVCKQGRMIVMSKYNSKPKLTTLYLIDLKTGENVYVTDSETEMYLFTNYLGDKFYVYNQVDEILREYDTKSKSLSRELLNIPIDGVGTYFISPDNEFISYSSPRQMIYFSDLNTGIVKDSLHIGSQQSMISFGKEFTNDSRYFNFTSFWIIKNGPGLFQIYDRQTKEIIFRASTPQGSHFPYQYFNTSNKMAFPEEVKLPGDDKVYSYIRIFDPDTRTIVKNIRISEYPNLSFTISMDDTKIIYRVNDPQLKYVNQIYNLKEDRFESLKFRASGPFLADSNAWYSRTGLALIAYKFDGTVGVEDAMSQESNKVYPNPSNGIVSLNITPEFVMGKWNVSDMQGRILRKGLIGHASVLEINIADLVPGTYFITVIGTDNKQSHKIIKF